MSNRPYAFRALLFLLLTCVGSLAKAIPISGGEDAGNAYGSNSPSLPQENMPASLNVVSPKHGWNDPGPEALELELLEKYSGDGLHVDDMNQQLSVRDAGSGAFLKSYASELSEEIYAAPFAVVSSEEGAGPNPATGEGFQGKGDASGDGAYPVKTAAYSNMTAFTSALTSDSGGYRNKTLIGNNNPGANVKPADAVGEHQFRESNAFVQTLIGYLFSWKFWLVAYLLVLFVLFLGKLVTKR